MVILAVPFLLSVTYAIPGAMGRRWAEQLEGVRGGDDEGAHDARGNQPGSAAETRDRMDRPEAVARRGCLGGPCDI